MFEGSEMEWMELRGGGKWLSSGCAAGGGGERRRRDAGLACGRPVLHSPPDIMTNYISNGSDIIKRDVWPVWSVSTPSPRPRLGEATPQPL